jgi:hypothetical protein
MKTRVFTALYWLMGLMIGLGAFGHGFLGVGVGPERPDGGDRHATPAVPRPARDHRVPTPTRRLVVSSLLEVTTVFVECFGKPFQDETSKKRRGQPPKATERQLNRDLYLRGLLPFGVESARKPCADVASRHELLRELPVGLTLQQYFVGKRDAEDVNCFAESTLLRRHHQRCELNAIMYAALRVVLHVGELTANHVDRP